MKNILQFLENTVEKYPQKKSFCTVEEEITYNQLLKKSKAIGTAIHKKTAEINRPIVIFMDKTINCITSMMGILYSGNFYTIIDTKSPTDRIKHIIDTLQPQLIITDKKNQKLANGLNIFNNIEILEDIENTEIEEEKLLNIRSKMIDTDPAYVLFTSGSTGIPKGTVVSHIAVISYINSIISTFNIDENTIFGNQTPFYFSMSVLDIYSTIFVGGTLYIIPKMYFSFPIKLLEYMQKNKINTIYWVPSALCIIANLKALENIELKNLNKILFAGEVMPIKQLNYWMKKIPNALYANLYGPTEVTDICTYYIIDKMFKTAEKLPIGKSCDNCNVIILKDDGTKAKKEEKGELCVRGSFLGMGYYGLPEKTKEVFIQNPLNIKYPEIIYKTGDIVKENNNGEFIYLGRKDFQIKHMGYRIELGEIETIANSIENIDICVCIYDEIDDKIILFYKSEKLNEKELSDKLSIMLLPYMRPSRIIKIDNIPYNSNGKIDRKKLKKDINIFETKMI